MLENYCANLLKRSDGKPSSGTNSKLVETFNDKLHFRSRRVELLEPFLTASVWRIFGVYPVQFMKAPPAEWMCSEPLWLEPPLRGLFAFFLINFGFFGASCWGNTNLYWQRSALAHSKKLSALVIFNQNMLFPVNKTLSKF